MQNDSLSRVRRLRRTWRERETMAQGDIGDNRKGRGDPRRASRRSGIARSRKRIGAVADLPASERCGSSTVVVGIPDGELAEGRANAVGQQEQLNQVLRLKAQALLVKIMNDDEAPAALRVSCAKTILSLTEKPNRQQDQEDDLDPDGMTAESIDRELARLSQADDEI